VAQNEPAGASGSSISDTDKAQRAPGPSVRGYELQAPLNPERPRGWAKARHTNLGRLVAMRRVEGSPEEPEVKAFLDTILRLAALHHPHVVSVADAGTCPDSGVHYLAVELLEGGGLDDLLAERSQLPREEALSIAQAACEALVCLEEAGMVHGDVRPANVLFDDDGTPKLAEVGQGAREPSLARAFTTSPEVFAGESPTIRSDLYGLGMILVRTLTGTYPYEGESWEELQGKHDEGHLSPALERCPEVLRPLVRSLSARDPALRYATAQEANLDLVRALAGAEPAGAGGLAGGGLTSAIQVQDVPGLPAAVARVAGAPFKVKLSSRGVTLAEYEFDQDTVTVGRSTSSDVHIDNPIVSRRHATLTRKGPEVHLTALSAVNMTSHNGKKLEGSVALAPGDEVVLSEKFHLEVTWDLDATPAPMPDFGDDDTPVVGTPRVSRGEDEAATPAQAILRDPSNLETDRRPPRPVSSEPLPPALPDDPYGATPVRGTDPYAEALADPYGPAVHMDEESPYGESTEPVAPARRRPEEDSLTDTDRRRLEGPPRGFLEYSRHGRAVRSYVDKGFQVGSSPACDLRLPKGEPRKAALVVRGVDAYRLYNVSPEASAVRLNGEPVNDQAVLEHGDTIDVCGESFAFSMS
jgi:hypothetical protein